MAVKQLSDDRDFDWEEYIIDSPEDAVDLPTTCGWGSTAICISNGDLYILNSDKEWTLFTINDNSGSEGSSESTST